MIPNIFFPSFLFRVSFVFQKENLNSFHIRSRLGVHIRKSYIYMGIVEVDEEIDAF